MISDNRLTGSFHVFRTFLGDLECGVSFMALICFHRYKWDVPVDFRTPNTNKSKIFWLHKEDASCKFSFPAFRSFKAENVRKKNRNIVRLEKPEDTPWIKLNVDQRGYYRVNYPPSVWKGIIRDLHRDHTVGRLASSVRHLCRGCRLTCIC